MVKQNHTNTENHPDPQNKNSANNARKYVYAVDSMSALLSSVGSSLSGFFKSQRGTARGEPDDDVGDGEATAHSMGDEAATAQQSMGAACGKGRRYSDDDDDDDGGGVSDGEAAGTAVGKKGASRHDDDDDDDDAAASTPPTASQHTAQSDAHASEQHNHDSDRSSHDQTQTQTQTQNFSDSDSAPQYDMVEHLVKHHYEGMQNGAATSAFVRALERDLKLLQSSLPEGVYVRSCESRMDLLRAAIVGPTMTPYEDGFFVFDVYLPAEYPHSPPQVCFLCVYVCVCVCMHVCVFAC